jgi:translation elongation factor P/translation initiation factor 5A
MGATISSNDFRNGVAIEVDGVPYKIVDFLHVVSVPLILNLTFGQ